MLTTGMDLFVRFAREEGEREGEARRVQRGKKVVAVWVVVVVCSIVGSGKESVLV